MRKLLPYILAIPLIFSACSNVKYALKGEVLEKGVYHTGNTWYLVPTINCEKGTTRFFVKGDSLEITALDNSLSTGDQVGILESGKKPSIFVEIKDFKKIK